MLLNSMFLLTNLVSFCRGYVIWLCEMCVQGVRRRVGGQMKSKQPFAIEFDVFVNEFAIILSRMCNMVL